MSISKSVSDFVGHVGGGQRAVSFGISKVVRQVGYGIGDSHDLCLERHFSYRLRRHEVAFRFGVSSDSVHHLVGQVEALAALFEYGQRPYALRGMGEAVGKTLVQNAFADVPEWCVPDVVGQRSGFDQIFVEVERTGDRTTNL